jgi:ubiquinol-cytochrome c reductase cytochrome b subunit
MGGYFLEYNNFIQADPLKTPAHIAPVWYFTPYYSILRATTEEFTWVLAAGSLGLGALIWFTAKQQSVKLAGVVGAVVVAALFFIIKAKVWGVLLMGGGVLAFALLPWLDQSPVKSIRYKGVLYKTALTIFLVSFIVLGYYGTQPVTGLGTRLSQLFTLLYFAFFALMPWYSRMDKTKPVPERVTW